MSELRARLARLSPEQRAALEEKMRRQPSPPRQEGIPRRAGGNEPPLSFGQERLWFLHRLDPADASYNMFMVQRLRGRISTAALGHALDRLVARHATLRARFTSRDGGPVQEIGPPLPVEPDLIDLTRMPAAERESHAIELVADLTNRPFDLALGPLLRVHLITLSETDHVLCVVLHHIVADGWSLKIMLREFAACYTAHLEGREAELPALPLEYADYAAWQRERLDEATVRRQLDYWSGQLAGVPVLDVPPDRPRPPVRSSNGDYTVRRIGPELAARVEQLAREERCTPFIVLLAAFQALLGAHSGQDDVCVGSVIAGRDRPELEPVVGFFPNTLALRGDLSGDPGFRELLGRTRATVLDAFAHQDIPFERLLNDLRIERDLSTTPLFQAMFVMQDKDASELVLPGVESGMFDPGARQAKFDLMLDVTPRSGSLYALLSYNADLFEPDTVDRMLRRYERMLEAVSDDRDIPLSRLRAAMLLPEDRLPGTTASLPVASGSIRPSGSAPPVARPSGTGGVFGIDSTSGAGGTSRTGSASGIGDASGVIDLFAERVRLAPDAIAVSHGDRRLSYAEVHARAVRLAARLTSAGVRPETVVAVCARRSPELVVALLAVAAAGGAYLPLDPAYPAERLRWMARDSGAALLLCQDGLLECDLPVITIDGPPDPAITLPPAAGPPYGMAVRPSDGAPPAPDPAALAYVIYTSGSTGRPKGVQVERRALAERVAWMRREYGIGPGDRVLQSASVGFDTHAEEIYPALTSGAELVLAPDEPLPDFLRTPQGAALTVIDLPTSYWRELVAARVAWPPSLRLLILGADPLPAPALAAWYAAHGERVSLVNSYGPTETTIIATAAELDPSEASRRPTVGRPLTGTRVHVLDEHGEQVPVGVPGELCVGGAGLSRGYRGSPGLTAARFVPDPYGPAGSRLYRTGDRARFRADGRLEILGRLDRQVKIRGYRVEPGEVEARLLAHPLIVQATVAVREDTPGDRRLVAYVVRREEPVREAERSGDPDDRDRRTDDQDSGDGTADDQATGDRDSRDRTTGDQDTEGGTAGDRVAGELRAYLAAELPPHLVPSAVVTVDRIPLTPAGKIDQGALPAPEHRSDRGYRPARTPAEKLVCSVWAQVLGVERVGVLDDFFQLGGHSLLATRTTARLSAAMGVEVPLKLVFGHPAARDLARALDRLAADGEGSERDLPRKPGAGPEVARRPEGTAPPLSFAQERLWFMEQFAPGTPAYVLPATARLRGPLDVDALQARLDGVVARHESLRMRFPATPDGQPEVRVVAAADPDARVRLRLAEAGSAEEARKIAGADAAPPFDLDRGPLMRATLVGLGHDDHVLLVAVHHIVADGWSAEILLDELLTGEDGPVEHPVAHGSADRTAGQSRAEPEIGYGDYARWQRDRMAGSRLERHLEFWRQELAGLPPLDLPLDGPRTVRRGHRGAWHDLRLDGALTSAVRELARAHGATLYMTLLAAFQATLARWSGQRDFAVGSPVSGRDRSEFEGLIGLFVNLLPLRARLDGDPTFAELLGRTRDAALDVYAHQELPFEKLVAELDLARDAARPPVVQVLFALQSYLGQTSGPGRSQAEPFSLDTTTTRFDLELYAAETGEGLSARFVYDRDLFRPDTVERLAAGFRTLLHAAVADPGTRLGDLEVLSPEERELVLTRWNATSVAFSPASTLHGLIEAQAVRTPDAPAVVFEDLTLTYAELDARAGLLAGRLTARGIGPGSVLAVRAERSLDLPVQLLAVLKSGAAYLPLDPGLPKRRVRLMLADAGAVELGAVLEAPAGAALEPAAGASRGGDVPEDSLAYVIFTSGSTGRPKGVGISHRAIVNRLRWMQRTYGLDSSDAVLQKTPAGFDVSVWELFWPLTAGARLVLARPGGHRDPAYLREIITDRRITTAHFVPSMLAAFTAEEGIEECRSLRRVVCSGEELTAGAARRLTDRLPGVELHNLYGPTEAAVDVSWHRYVPGEQVVPIGRPVDNTRLYVLDEALRPVPVGTPGQLFIGGVQLARGYLGRPALTAERFLPDPYGPPGSRLYATGDRARWRPDGELDYLGRLDTQVKIRGMRVEPGEIEAVLIRHPDLRAAAVGVWHDGSGARLVGYGVRREDAAGRAGDGAADQAATGDGDTLGDGDTPGAGGTPGDRDTPGDGGVTGSAGGAGRPDPRDWLRDELPEHMIPTVWVMLDALPLTPNGKLDRAALPPPPRGGDLPWEPPRTKAEDVVAEVWQAVLGLDEVGRHDGFFAVGGDSIRSLSVVARLRSLGYALDLQHLFTHQTVAELATVLGTPGHGPSAGPEPAPATEAFGLLSPEDLAKLRKGDR
ncbi:non-ribosomal peptide synthetase [Streptosporangium sp. NBC_01756]|uniref:non-ribosomal peptide synthetase n=1 Tax=Streptosporangium sp. NBC_01756 TaxID=2975950 RepID=UPI002DDA0D86|nr:non-ribosomal peptide synthetase [Streptosporangium sp. NBC_01756]WSC85152.1 amino acid adenylation domain-containing protein [Streptosporangium sp. NBC_01756]